MLGVGILFKARQLRAHHGPCLEGDGEPLKETLTAIAHPCRGAPPLSPAEALPAALACVDFCVVALPALLDSASTDDEGVLATLKSARADSGVEGRVDGGPGPLGGGKCRYCHAVAAGPQEPGRLDARAQGPPHKSEERDGTRTRVASAVWCCPFFVAAMAFALPNYASSLAACKTRALAILALCRSRIDGERRKMRVRWNPARGLTHACASRAGGCRDPTRTLSLPRTQGFLTSRLRRVRFHNQPTSV